MAINVWSSLGSTDGNDGANWSLGVLAPTDTLTFDNTSAVNCIFTGNISCNDFIMSMLHTGTVSCGAHTFTVAGNIIIDNSGGGALVQGTSTFIITGNSAILSNEHFHNIDINAPFSAITLMSHLFFDNDGQFRVIDGMFNSGNFSMSGGSYIFGGTANLILGTSSIYMNGPGPFRISTTGVRLTNLATIAIAYAGTATVDFCNGANTIFARLLTIANGSIVVWTPSIFTLWVNAPIIGDWGVFAGANVNWVSAIPGTPYLINVAIPFSTWGMSPVDCHNIGVPIDATAPSNHDGGGNFGWIFPAVIGGDLRPTSKYW
jgi:hypothetical protein